jgi:tetratricopeptide (TPR) repeat protein
MSTTFRSGVLAVAAALVALTLPAAAQTAASAAAGQIRAIVVSTEPSATVWLNGIRFGKTDKSGKLEIRTAMTGARTLRVRADGFKEKSMPLAPTAKGDVTVALVKTDDPAELAFQEAERLSSQDREKAAEAYRNAIKLRPAYADAYLSLARVLLEQEYYDEAAAAIVGARKARPGWSDASAVDGRIHKENGDEAKAIAAFKRAIAEGKGFQPEAYAGLGLLYKEKAEGFGGAGDFANEDASYTEAAKNLKTAVKQLSGAPDTVVIYQLLGLIYERQKKYAEAIAVYEEFLRIFPDSTEASAVRSFIVQLKKDMAAQ